ncbi:unnamed protein product [Ambrosiozyma monospora]|uniref:Unnamed protein product n=1 Tax=Ambrosiozyma monospora TaxID=43982 RepID=A0ACB5SWD6_AMBMO|nr:unnamed protein product [Ambrosiozyma monospora]
MDPLLLASLLGANKQSEPQQHRDEETTGIDDLVAQLLKQRDQEKQQSSRARTQHQGGYRGPSRPAFNFAYPSPALFGSQEPSGPYDYAFGPYGARSYGGRPQFRYSGIPEYDEDEDEDEEMTPEPEVRNAKAKSAYYNPRTGATVSAPADEEDEDEDKVPFKFIPAGGRRNQSAKERSPFLLGGTPFRLADAKPVYGYDTDRFGHPVHSAAPPIFSFAHDAPTTPFSFGGRSDSVPWRTFGQPEEEEVPGAEEKEEEQESGNAYDELIRNLLQQAIMKHAAEEEHGGEIEDKSEQGAIKDKKEAEGDDFDPSKPQTIGDVLKALALKRKTEAEAESKASETDKKATEKAADETPVAAPAPASKAESVTSSKRGRKSSVTSSHAPFSLRNQVKRSPSTILNVHAKNTKVDDDKLLQEPDSPLRVSAPQHNTNKPFSPPMNAYDFENNYILVLSLPGVTKEFVDINFHPSTSELVIKGEVKNPYLADDDDYLDLSKILKVSEQRFGSFERVVKLPSYPLVDESGIKAKFLNGVLEIKVPKLKNQPAAKKIRKIELEDIPDEELERESVAEPVISS